MGVDGSGVYEINASDIDVDQIAAQRTAPHLLLEAEEVGVEADELVGDVHAPVQQDLALHRARVVCVCVVWGSRRRPSSVQGAYQPDQSTNDHGHDFITLIKTDTYIRARTVADGADVSENHACDLVPEAVLRLLLRFGNRTHAFEVYITC